MQTCQVLRLVGLRGADHKLGHEPMMAHAYTNLAIDRDPLEQGTAALSGQDVTYQCGSPRIGASAAASTVASAWPAPTSSRLPTTRLSPENRSPHRSGRESRAVHSPQTA